MSASVILLVDDERDLLHVVSTALAHIRPDLLIESTTSVKEAEESLRRIEAEGRTLALAVVDYRLRGEDGLELLYRVRERHPEVPTVLFTGQASAEAEQQARQAGARVLWKPMALVDLLGEVQELLAS